MTLKILSYNIQAAIGTKTYRQYLTKVNRQLFHTHHKNKTLRSIAKFASDYDVACFQEVDLGGRRSGYNCQVDHLLKMSKFSHMSSQENRVVGNISRHGNAILSKHPQSDVQDLKLPGKRTGRGALLSKIDAPKPFYILNVHLSLGLMDQMEQVEYLIENTPPNSPIIISGDFNCGSSSQPLRRLADALDLSVLTTPHHKSYPSWNPRKDFDHILISPHFHEHNTTVVDVLHSDHRPVGACLSH